MAVRSLLEAQDRKWVWGWISLVVIMAVSPWILLMGPWRHSRDSTAELSAVVGLVGAVLTALVALIGMTVTRQANRRLSLEREQSERRLQQEHRDEQGRLKLDAAMRAGALFSSTTAEPVDPASVASSLLALTKLDNADLAVTLLVDFWSDATEKVSTEAAILVIDARLRSKIWGAGSQRCLPLTAACDTYAGQRD
jgi:type II secretory pathway pseudopilin PulG